MGNLTADLYEAALLALIGDWLASEGATSIVACGMVGAQQGWIEAPYLVVPCAPHAPVNWLTLMTLYRELE